MGIEISDVVLALKGRDSGKVFLVVGLEGDYALIADGRGRRLEKPKKKKLRHLHPVGKSGVRISEKLRTGQKVTNSDIRKELAEGSQDVSGEKGGMQNG